MTLFGPLLPALQVERAVYNRLRVRLPTYLSQVAVADGLTADSLSRPKSYATASQFGRSEDALPCIGIHVPGVSEQHKTGDGNYRVKWALEVGALVMANTEVNTDRLAKLYGAAIWGAVMQGQSLGGVAENIEWPDGGERYDELPSARDSSRSLAFALLRFDVLAIDFRSTYGGPTTFNEDPEFAYGDWPSVATIHVDVEPLPD